MSTRLQRGIRYFGYGFLLIVVVSTCMNLSGCASAPQEPCASLQCIKHRASMDVQREVYTQCVRDWTKQERAILRSSRGKVYLPCGDIGACCREQARAAGARARK